MRVNTTERGFTQVLHTDSEGDELSIAQESLADGPYENALDNPGSSYLWIGGQHLDRESVTVLTSHLIGWLKTGRLKEKIDTAPIEEREINVIELSRAVFAEMFKEDPGFRQSYVDNVAMLLHDRHGITNHEARNKAASEIIHLIFESDV